MTSNYIDSTGLVLQQLSDIVTELENGFKSIYGNDINLDPNSPDGQIINLFAQSKIDILDLISSVYNSFSPNSAIGVSLDQRCAINGIVRKGATKTTVTITLTTDRVVNIVGVTSGTGTPFTVSDGSGNKFYLTNDTTTINGVNYLNFTAAIAGAIEVSPATITNIETITLGVLSVTNAGGALIQGEDEETDAALRFRRSVSVSNPSSGYLDGLTGALLALVDVQYAKVYENNTDITDANGIPPHSIWVVVDGGNSTDIANTIYQRRNAGCGMYYGTGSTGPTGPSKVVSITQVNGFDIAIKYSEAKYYDLYIALVITSITNTHNIDQTFIKNSIYQNIKYGINDVADYSAISAYVKSIDPLAVIISGGVGVTGAAADPFLDPPTIDGRWIISTTNIDITTV